MNSLPIHEVLDEIKSTLLKSQIIVVEAPPGAGKTTVIPISLLNEDWLNGRKILLLEPRRLAARNAAYRMSDSLKEEVGNTVGYRIRFESKVSSKTKIEVVTEGIFTRKIQADPELKDIALIIFDEFHERNLQTDLGLALALESQSALREDLKIIIMSATLDGKSLSSFLNAPVVKSEGRSFPVEIRYLNSSKEKLNLSILSALKSALADKGDILVFLPGAGEIKRVQKEIEENFNLANILICPLYGELSQKEQAIAINPDKSGRRKIILSTNIAESSLTIEGVNIVIDSGLCRIPRFDPSSGMTKLITTNIAKDSITQRTGRAGRLGPGISYRIWSKEEETHFLEQTRPEILEIELSQFLLEVSAWGARIEELRLMDKPLESSIARSKNLLKSLHLLDENDKITNLGKQVIRFPLHPRLSNMVLIADKMGFLNLASILSGLLNEKNIFSSGHSYFKQADLSLQLEEFLKNSNSFTSKKIRLASDEIIRICSNGKKTDSSDIEISKLGLLLSISYPDRLARAREKGSRHFKLSSGKGAVLRENDFLVGSEFLVIAELDGDVKEALIYSAAKISKDDILEFHKKEIIEKRSAYLDEKTGRISVFLEKKLGELILESKEIESELNEEILTEVWKNYFLQRGLSTLNWSEEVDSFRKRSEFLRLQGIDFPPLDEDSLWSSIDIWLLPYLVSIRRISELKSLDLLSILRSLYSYQQLSELDRDAPERWEAPSGSKIKLEYKEKEVFLSVKIQELFGMLETPKIAKGRIAITLQLLSPAQKPIQITKDIVSFWDRTYLEVKKELAGRYPRHPWPDNPRTAMATKFTKKRALKDFPSIG